MGIRGYPVAIEIIAVWGCILLSFVGFSCICFVPLVSGRSARLNFTLFSTVTREKVTPRERHVPEWLAA
jgi:hypothetical protein